MFHCMIDGGTGAERENTKLITYKKPHPDIKEKPLASKLTIGGIGKKKKKEKGILSIACHN